MPIKIVAILQARPGKSEELRALLEDLRPKARAEPGNLRWDVWQDKAKADRFVIDELFADDSAVAAHRETPHFKAYLEVIGDLAERSSMALDPVFIS